MQDIVVKALEFFRLNWYQLDFAQTRLISCFLSNRIFLKVRINFISMLIIFNRLAVVYTRIIQGSSGCLSVMTLKLFSNSPYLGRGAIYDIAALRKLIEFQSTTVFFSLGGIEIGTIRNLSLFLRKKCA